MENLVVTLETAKKLKVAGFPQETEFIWYALDGNETVVPRIEAHFRRRLEYALGEPRRTELHGQQLQRALGSNDLRDSALQRWDSYLEYPEGGKEL